MSNRERKCYICIKNFTRNTLSDVPVCEECMSLHFNHLEKEEKKEEPINLDLNLGLNWDEEDTQPMWATLLNGDEDN